MTDVAADDTPGLLHRTVIGVRWRDLDAFNHVNERGHPLPLVL